jgi:histidinol-phosphate aminotransferase
MAMGIIGLINENVRQLEPYTLKAAPAMVKLNQNENPFDIPLEIKNEILETFKQKSWNRYPEVLPFELIDLLAECHHYPADGIIVANGSNELLYTVMMTVVSTGVKVLIPSPTFFLYEKAVRIMNGEIVHVMMKDDLTFHTEQILAAIQNENPRLTILVSPNSPTGQSIAYEDVERILQATGGLVLVDEAYIEFSEKQSVFSLLKDYENLILLRTFSKSFSAAGLRIGYLLTAPGLCTEILKPKIPFTVGILAQIFTQVILRHLDLVQDRIGLIKRERNRVYDALQKIEGVRAFPSDSNFLLFQTEKTSGEIFNGLLRRGVLVRDVSSYPMLDRMLRVNAGTAEENGAFLSALRDTLQT